MQGQMVASDKVCWPEMLRLVRGTRFWTFAQMAAQLRVSIGTLQRWEAGGDTPDLAVQRLIRDLLEQPVGPADLCSQIRHGKAPRYLFRTDRTPLAGKPSRILEVSDTLVADQPLGRNVFFANRTQQQADLTAETDAMLNAQGQFFGGEMAVATVRAIWLQYVQGGMTVRHALTRWVPMKLSDGTPVCIYERRTVTPSAYMSLPSQPVFTPLDCLGS